jgi:trk system potassium uptake protein TrkH
VITLRRLRRGARRESIGVDVRSAVALAGTNIKYLSLALLAPTAVALAYSEPPWPFLLAGAIGFVFGLGLERGLGSATRMLGAREGFLIVSLTWLLAAALSAVTYILAGEAPLDRPLDAYFESMSGFTTTGATVLTTQVEDLPNSLLFWRQLSQWLGGMGIIVLAIAVLPRLRVGGRQLLESEMPGPEIEQLTVRIRDTARQLWLLYIGLTLLMIAILLGVSWSSLDPELGTFEAIVHPLTTLPTGGFSTETRSLESFNAVTHWVVIVFMIVSGANFALMYRSILRRRPALLYRDEELRLYLAFAVVATVVLTVVLLGEDIVAGGEAAVRHAALQAVSIMTTTGYASIDFNTWPLLALAVLIGLMFIGGSAGSTSGSVKVVRHLLMGKILRRELDATVHPEIVSRVRLNRAAVDERILRAISSFVLIYIGLFVVGTMLLVVDAARVGLDLRLIDAVTVSATMIGNVGPALGVAGPMGSYDSFSDFSKLVMIALMWLGRLEIVPIIVLFTRNYWRA